MSSMSSDLLGCCGMGAKPRPLDSRLIVSRERFRGEVDHIITFVTRLPLSSPAMVETCW